MCIEEYLAYRATQPRYTMDHPDDLDHPDNHGTHKIDDKPVDADTYFEEFVEFIEDHQL